MQHDFNPKGNVRSSVPDGFSASIEGNLGLYSEDQDVSLLIDETYLNAWIGDTFFGGRAMKVGGVGAVYRYGRFRVTVEKMKDA